MMHSINNDGQLPSLSASDISPLMIQSQFYRDAGNEQHINKDPKFVVLSTLTLKTTSFDQAA